MYSQIDNVLTDRRWHLSVLIAQSFIGAVSVADHYLVVKNL
jgi:hypothetical protein